jgi:hypothetical protein
MLNLKSNLIGLTFKNNRNFSHTASKYMESESDMMKKINTMLEKSKAFEKQVKTSSDLIKDKNKMGVLKEEE